ncbi:calmodulin-binding protein 60 E-like isoform X3 [Durio zibethinus]|uniref:Calmodulin-binding protein 60 E-like isoform X3 n=1 Tax=Durio zibethinus TaxID=66656 RepID=A0A6P5ZCY8_DURZI|nr:calmodulin-binding protein 60 E-like isoform X3 [Durio zibethinus]
MESSRNKRGYEEGVEDAGYITAPKKPKLPTLASVIVEALKVDSIQRLCSSLEPMLRRIVSEEVERALTRIQNAKLTGRCSPPRIQSADGRSLQLHFRTRMPPHLFTGGKVEGEQGAAIHVVLLDVISGTVVQTGPESAAKLNVVVLEGDFNEEADEDWTKEHFENYEVKEREGKRPLLTGELQVTLKEGVGTLADLTFTDNSSWIRSRKFRLGLKVASGYCEGIRVREAKTEAFSVKDHRGESYKKHYPPALHDEVWRLDRIAKDGALHRRLLKAEIVTVKDFLQLLVRNPQRLRNILGSGMSNRMWENTVEHAKTCDLGGKLYVYYSDQTNSTGVVFNHIYELRGLIAEGQFLPLESLDHNQKVFVDSLVKRSYENWHQLIEFDGDWSRPRDGHGFEDFFAEEIRLRSSEMLETDDMQRLLKTLGVGFGMGAGFGHSDEACYTCNIPYDHRMDYPYAQERGKGSGKAVVGWLKLKAALRWGIFIRKRAAERRAQLVELD